MYHSYPYRVTSLGCHLTYFSTTNDYYLIYSTNVEKLRYLRSWTWVNMEAFSVEVWGIRMSALKPKIKRHQATHAGVKI